MLSKARTWFTRKIWLSRYVNYDHEVKTRGWFIRYGKYYNKRFPQLDYHFHSGLSYDEVLMIEGIG